VDAGTGVAISVESNISLVGTDTCTVYTSVVCAILIITD